MLPPEGTRSVWLDETPDEPTDPIGTAPYEICVVGAGIAGLSVAYALARAGRSVIVLDDGPIGGGETGRTSAHLTSALDDRYYRLEHRFGEAGARTAATAHAAAIDAIERTVAELDIDCDFRRVDGYLFTPRANEQELAHEADAATRAGLTVELVEAAPLPFDTGPALRFARQAEFHPLAYLRGLAAGFRAAGGRIRTGVHVLAIEPPTDDGPIVVRADDDSEVRAQYVVDATNASITSRYDLPLRQAAYRSYAMAFAIPVGAIPHALYWDTEDPYHYLRVARGPDGGEVLVAGGHDHRTGQGDPDAAFPALEAWVRERIAIAGAVVARWSGQIMEPAAGLGYVGRSNAHDRLFVVSGDGGEGLTNGALAGILITALVIDGDHAWASVFDPRGNHLRGLGTLLHEGALSSSGYAAWLRRGESAPAPGTGTVMRHGLHLVAVYRDAAGACHLRSARCPHAQGIVTWNPVEDSWDCKCHGSRFDAFGAVINSPTAHPLPELDESIATAVRAKLD